jgi:hypothetical protein
MTHDFNSSGEDDSDSQGNDVPPDTQPVCARRSSPWRLPIAGGSVLVIVAVVLALLAFLQLVPGNSTPSRQAKSTSTATPIPRVLYTADWSHGTNGWTLPSHWRLVKGHIESDGYGTEPLLIPYQVTVPNYSVAVDFTVEKVPDYAACHSYGIAGYSSGNSLQFLGSIACIRKLAVAYHAFSENYVTHADSVGDEMSTQDFTVLFYTQTFSLQVQGNNNVDFCPGVACLANVVSTTPLSPLHIAIYDVGVQMSVSRIVIYSP